MILWVLSILRLYIFVVNIFCFFLLLISKMDETSRRNVKIAGTRALVDLLRVYTDRDLTMKFIARSAGLRVPLVWPQGFFFVIAGILDIEALTEEDVIAWSKLLCCPEKLQLFAYVARGSRSFRQDSPLLLLGEAGRVYAVLPWRKHEIWRVGDNIDSFLKRGLSRMNSFRDSSTADLVLSDATPDLLEIGSRAQLLNFRSRNLGRQYHLTWPKGDTLLFSQARDSFHAADRDVAAELKHMSFFATFGPATYSGAGRVSLYVDKKSRIFAFDDNVGRLMLVAESFTRFLRVGVKPFFKSYVFTAEGYRRRHRPLCPRSLFFVGKIEYDVAADLLLRTYYEAKCFGGARHGSDDGRHRRRVGGGGDGGDERS